MDFFKVLRLKVTIVKKRFFNSWNGSVIIVHEFKKNFLQLVDDIENGKAFHDKHSQENIISTIGDITKMIGMGAIFVLPGGSAGVIALKKFLDSDRAAKLRIPNFLELSIYMKTAPLDPMPEVPVNGLGSFGFVVSYYDNDYTENKFITTGVTLKCPLNSNVRSIECGDVVLIDNGCVYIEGSSGVFTYYSLYHDKDLKVGDNVECGQLLGTTVIEVLTIELMEHKHRAKIDWEHGQPKPDALLDPTHILSKIKSGS